MTVETGARPIARAFLARAGRLPLMRQATTGANDMLRFIVRDILTPMAAIVAVVYGLAVILP